MQKITWKLLAQYIQQTATHCIVCDKNIHVNKICLFWVNKSYSTNISLSASLAQCAIWYIASYLIVVLNRVLQGEQLEVSLPSKVVTLEDHSSALASQTVTTVELLGHCKGGWVNTEITANILEWPFLSEWLCTHWDVCVLYSGLHNSCPA